MLFGHSMGSFLAQGVVQRWGDEYAGLVLSGTTGFPVSNGYVQDMLVGCAETWTDAEARVPSDLPVLVTGGNEDPVGGGTGTPGARALASRWRDHGVEVDERYYEDGRHEMLNEVNRDEVMTDLVTWIRARVA